jgi:hypothetical protein
MIRSVLNRVDPKRDPSYEENDTILLKWSKPVSDGDWKRMTEQKPVVISANQLQREFIRDEGKKPLGYEGYYTNYGSLGEAKFEQKVVLVTGPVHQIRNSCVLGLVVSVLLAVLGAAMVAYLLLASP